MVIRELSAPSNVRCSSSKAVIIFSICSCLSGTVAPGSALSHPDLDLVAVALLTTPVCLSAPVLRRHCFRYWLGLDGKDLSGTTEARGWLGGWSGGLAKSGWRVERWGVQCSWCGRDFTIKLLSSSTSRPDHSSIIYFLYHSFNFKKFVPTVTSTH